MWDDDDEYEEFDRPLNSRPRGVPDDSSNQFEVGDIVRLRAGTYHLRIESVGTYRATLKYLHRATGERGKEALLTNLVKIPDGEINPVTNEPSYRCLWGDALTQIHDQVYDKQPEEQPMSKYGNQSHDQMLEALISKQYKTVGVKFPGEQSTAYHYRAPVDMELYVEDKVIVSSRLGGEEHFTMATIVSTDDDNSPKAVAWVVQKVDTSAHEQRTAEWKTLYEGIKEAEMEKKRAILAEGYEAELAKYAPEAAKVLAAMNTPQLEKKDA